MSIMDVDGHDLGAVVIRWWLVVMSGYPRVLSGKSARILEWATPKWS